MRKSAESIPTSTVMAAGITLIVPIFLLMCRVASGANSFGQPQRKQSRPHSIGVGFGWRFF